MYIPPLEPCMPATENKEQREREREFIDFSLSH